MNLTTHELNLTNMQFAQMMKENSKAERAMTLEMINLIREAEHRQVHVTMGFSSLFEYVTKYLGYEESAALRRISAARLMKDIPEVEAKIREGHLNLSNLSAAQTFFRREEKLQERKLTVKEKQDVISKLENKSSREGQRVLIELSPEQVKFKEKVRLVNSDLTELKVLLDKETMAKLEKLRGLLSHKNPQMTMAELIDELADIALAKLDPAREPKRKLQNAPSPPQVTSKAPRANSRYIPASIKREVWQRDGGKCTCVNQQTGHRCNSTFQLEIHHVTPYSTGGESSLENLKLMCKPHNLEHAINDFGQELMSRFVPRLSG